MQQCRVFLLDVTSIYVLFHFQRAPPKQFASKFCWPDFLFQESGRKTMAESAASSSSSSSDSSDSESSPSSPITQQPDDQNQQQSIGEPPVEGNGEESRRANSTSSKSRSSSTSSDSEDDEADQIRNKRSSRSSSESHSETAKNIKNSSPRETSQRWVSQLLWNWEYFFSDF